MLPSLADAADLDAWANRLDARSRLPELVRRLITTTAADVKRLEIRSGEGTGYKGYDGIVEVGQGNAFVPIDLSVWEMGVDQQPKAKAEKDFAKRTDDPLNINPSVTTFVFLTPRRWGGKDDWAAEKVAAGPWKDVRVIDGDNLQSWLELLPVVHAWISQLLGKAPDDAEDLETFWSGWREATSPHLSAELIISGRMEAVDAIAQHLQDPPSALTVRADSQAEALAFIAASFARLAEPERDAVFSRALIVHSANAWRQVARAERPLILIPTFKQVEPVQATRTGHYVFIPTGRETAKSSGVVGLPRLNRYAAENALKAMGIGEDRAAGLAVLGRRSLLSLRRKLALNRELQEPAWARAGRTGAVLPAMLAGSWNEAREGDCAVLATLAGGSYEDFLRDLTVCANESDPPVRRVGTVWFLISKEDAWGCLLGFLTSQDLDRFQQAIFAVLGAKNLALELPPEDRWQAGALGKARPHSGRLRKGLADTLAVMAAHSANATIAGVSTGQEYATGTVRTLLQRANQDKAGHVWWSLADVLPLLAEAAPDSFLEAVDIGTDGSDPVLKTLFTDSRGDSSTSSTQHPYLLWTLERLAWAPAYLSRVALLLARLMRLDPGGKLGNRPDRSLREIFLPLHPQTAAALGQRLKAIDMLRQYEPHAAWTLMISLLPKSHGVSWPTNSPRWRTWKAEGPNEVTYQELWQTTEALVARVLEDAGTDGGRLCAVVERISSLPEPSRTAVFEHLEALDPSSLDNSGRKALWDKLRRVMHLHRRYTSEKWAMPADEVDRIAHLYERFEPKDSVDRATWLFGRRLELPDVDEADCKKYGEAVLQARMAACEDIYRAQGVNGLFALAEAVENPWLLGCVIGRSSKIAKVMEKLFLAELLSSDMARRELASGYITGCLSRSMWAWIDEQLDDSDLSFTPEQWAQFFLSLPKMAETWDRLDRQSEETRRIYWAKFRPPTQEPSDCLRAVEQLLKYGRAWVALDLLAMHMHGDKVVPTPEQVMDVLEAAVRSPMNYSNPLLSYDVAKLLDFLERAGDVDENRLATIEWICLPIFRFEHRPMKVLHNALASDPEFFVEAVSLAYKAKDEESRELDEETRHRAELAYDLLDSWRQPPGQDDTGMIDAAALMKWITTARRLLAEKKRAEVGDQLIGQVLHYTKPDADESWPPLAVRDLIERVRSERLERGLARKAYNSRGLVSRELDEGGQQERTLAQKHQAYAELAQTQWPRTAAMLRSIATEFESEARYEDTEAELDQDEG